MQYTPHIFKVNGVALEAGVYEPKRSRNLVIFTPGISATFTDYNPFLQDLNNNNITVIAYNVRGHGKSEGRMTQQALVEDLEALIGIQEQPLSLVGHSLGANISAHAHGPVKSQLFLAPFISKHSLSGMNRLGYGLMRALHLLGTLAPLDRYATKKGPEAGFNNREPVHDFVELSTFNAHRLPQRRTGWVIPDKDEMLGTWTSSAHYEALKNQLQKAYPDGFNMSFLAKGLNHCFNLKPFDFTPFFKTEDKHTPLARTIAEFLR
jgi:pimeloyl-ACP methyl ester carboxylesterase